MQVSSNQKPITHFFQKNGSGSCGFSSSSNKSACDISSAPQKRKAVTVVREDEIQIIGEYEYIRNIVDEKASIEKDPKMQKKESIALSSSATNCEVPKTLLRKETAKGNHVETIVVKTARNTSKSEYFRASQAVELEPGEPQHSTSAPKMLLKKLPLRDCNEELHGLINISLTPEKCCPGGIQIE